LKVYSKDDWTNVGVRSEASYTDIELVPGTEYTIYVRAVDTSGRQTASISTKVVSDLSAPVAPTADMFDDGPASTVCATLDVVGLTVGWQGLFSETVCANAGAVTTTTPCLRYMFNIGETAGQGNVIRWRDSSAVAQVTVSDSELPFWLVHGADGALNLTVTVMATNLVGLTNTASFSIYNRTACSRIR
jgi:hypothetical protein